MSIYRNQAQRVFDYALEKFGENKFYTVDDIEKSIEDSVKRSGLNGKQVADALIKIIDRQLSKKIRLQFDAHLVIIDEWVEANGNHHLVDIYLETPKGFYKVEGFLSDDNFKDLEHRVIYDRFVSEAKKVYEKNNI